MVRKNLAKTERTTGNKNRKHMPYYMRSQNTLIVQTTSTYISKMLQSLRTLQLIISLRVIANFRTCRLEFVFNQEQEKYRINFVPRLFDGKGV